MHNLDSCFTWLNTPWMTNQSVIPAKIQWDYLLETDCIHIDTKQGFCLVKQPNQLETPKRRSRSFLQDKSPSLRTKFFLKCFALQGFILIQQRQVCTQLCFDFGAEEVDVPINVSWKMSGFFLLGKCLMPHISGWKSIWTEVGKCTLMHAWTVLSVWSDKNSTAM